MKNDYAHGRAWRVISAILIALILCACLAITCVRAMALTVTPGHHGTAKAMVHNTAASIQNIWDTTPSEKCGGQAAPNDNPIATDGPDLADKAIPLDEMPEPVPDTDVPVSPYVFSNAVPLDDSLQMALQDAANEFNVPYAVALSVPEHETRFRNIAGDNGNSIGYFQIQPYWWSWLMDDIGVTDLWDPAQNFRGGCAIIQYLTNRYGSLTAGLHNYNPGYRDLYGNPYETVILNRASHWEAVISTMEA